MNVVSFYTILNLKVLIDLLKKNISSWYLWCIRNFKHIKGKDIICFEDTGNNLLINIKGIGDTIITHPLIYDTTPAGLKPSVPYKSYKNFTASNGCSPYISMFLTDFSRILKSLKNTSDTYEIVINDNSFNISNTNPVPMSFIIPLQPDMIQLSGISVGSTLTNNCILRLL